jgi:hypothetical protein
VDVEALLDVGIADGGAEEGKAFRLDVDGVDVRSASRRV